MKKNKMNNQELSVFCQQISLILQAGMSCYEGLAMIKDDCKNQETQNLFQEMMDSLEAGESFYHTLLHAQVFPQYMQDMVQIGERSGKLEDVMTSLCQHYQREHEIKEQIKNALTYPLVMIVMMFIVIFVLITQVLPIFERVFEQLGTSLTGISLMTLKIGSFLSQYYYVFFLFIGLIGVVILYLVKTKKFNTFLQTFILTRNLSSTIATGHFLSGVSIALSSGLDINESIDMAKQLVKHQALLAKIVVCQNLLNDYEDLSTALVKSQILTGLNARLIQIGFKTGTVDKIIGEIALKYNDEASAKINSLISIIEPTLVAILSIIVGIVLLSVMLPLIGIMSSLG